MSIPAECVDLLTAFTAPENTFVNVFGVVVDLMPPKATMRREFVCTVKLLDQQLASSAEAPRGVTFRFFKKNEDDLPKIRSLGDIIRARNIKMATFQGQRLAVSHLSTSVVVFPVNAIPTPTLGIAYSMGEKKLDTFGFDTHRVTAAEQLYVMNLKQTMSERLASLPSVPGAFSSTGRVEEGPPSKKQKQSSAFGAKFRLVEALEPGTWADILGQVVKIFPDRYGNCDLYVTDYTANKQMRYYPAPEEETGTEKAGDTFGYGGPPKKAWPGPYGYLVLKINLKPPHSRFAASEVKQGDIVLLRNVKMRITKEGTWLEGDMWPDDMDSNRVQIRQTKGQELPEKDALMERRGKYFTSRMAPTTAVPEENQKPSKSERSRIKKERQKRKDRDKANTDSETGVAVVPQDGLANRSGLNQHVRCSHEDVTITSVSDILDEGHQRHTCELPDGRSYAVPFINARYRVKVRIVDYEPKALEDFSVLNDDNNDDVAADSDAEMSGAGPGSPPKYAWYFQLQLEDASKAAAANKRLWVDVGHEQAQFLFGNGVDDPSDLRQNKQQLLRLQEKMFVLWGNLHEAGADQLSNLPFECCIMEYGVETNSNDPMGWTRVYGMFGTTIL